MGLWNSAPKKPGEDNVNTAPVSFAAKATKCPNCSANIFFEPEIASMLCKHCGGVFDPNTLESLGSFGVAHEHNYTGDGDMTEEDKQRQEYYCDSCGAVLVTDINTASTFCPFCGSPALITRKLTKEFRPDKIIPFKIDRKKAEEQFKEYIGSKKHVKGFIKKHQLKKMTALYVPFWLISSCIETDMSGTGKKNTGVLNLYSIYEVNGKFKYWVKGVPFDASRKIANKLMEAIEPFDYKEMVDFAPEYLQGFYADSYDQLPQEMIPRISRRMNQYSTSEAQALADGLYEFQLRYDKTFTIFRNISALYCLLPVWFLNIEAGGRNYQFAVNGQTGEVSGQLPDSAALTAGKGLINFYHRHRGICLAVFMVLTILTMCIGFGLMMSAAGFAYVIGCILGALGGIGICADFLFIFIADRSKEGVFTGNLGIENDFDKMPPLSAYFDEHMKSSLEKHEVLLRQYSVIRDENGNVVETKDIPVL